jgi:HEAT repeat protein
MVSLALAQKCGVKSPAIELAVKRASTFFRYYIDKAAIPYGDHDPYPDTHDNNGVCSSAAVFFDLIGDAQGAQYFSRMATASYGIRESGHTGHFWSHLWAAPGVNRAGKQASTAFLKELWWYFDLERRWDGGFGYQAAPGSKGDSTKGWDCTGARLLVYTLPRRALYITGRDMPMTDRLTGDALQATIEAGRGVSWGNRKTIYDGKSQDELFALLGNWSPIVRHRAAMSLGRRSENVTDALLMMVADGDANRKLGALTALQFQGNRAGAAVPLLTKLLTDQSSATRIAAIRALKGIGEAARPAVPELLRVARLTFPDDPRNLTRRNIGSVLFNDALLNVKTVDREELFLAVQELLRVDDGRARGQVAWLYKQLSFDDLKPILPDILWAVKNPSPSGIMFAAGIRDAGLELLSENKVEEAIPLLAQYARDQQQWGSQKRIVHILAMLERYGAHAQRVLPELEALAEFCRTEPGFPEWARKVKREAVEASIERIKAATAKPVLMRLKTED